jgi:hypothetical protein
MAHEVVRYRGEEKGHKDRAAAFTVNTTIRK